MSIKKPPLTIQEYEQIFRTIHGFLLSTKANPSTSCLFFSIVGSVLLQQYHALNKAVAVIGTAEYNLRTPNNICHVFGEIENRKLISTSTAFHSWVEVDGWIIDFSAPLFGDMVSEEQAGAKIPSFMFQKIDVPSSPDMTIPGVYFHNPDSELSHKMKSAFVDREINMEYITLCFKWYKPFPAEMPSLKQLSMETGEISEIKLSPHRIIGAW